MANEKLKAASQSIKDQDLYTDNEAPKEPADEDDEEESLARKLWNKVKNGMIGSGGTHDFDTSISKQKVRGVIQKKKRKKTMDNNQSGRMPLEKLLQISYKDSHEDEPADDEGRKDLIRRLLKRLRKQPSPAPAGGEITPYVNSPEEPS